MKTKLSFLIILVIALLIVPEIAGAQETGRHRLLVLTDIEADPDDAHYIDGPTLPAAVAFWKTATLV